MKQGCGTGAVPEGVPFSTDGKEAKKNSKYKTVQVSVETFDLLCSLKSETQKIFEKKISFDEIIRWLIVAKVDWADLVFARKILADEERQT